MIFKRKKQRNIRPGDFVELKHSVQKELLRKSYETSKTTKDITNGHGVYQCDLTKNNPIKIEHCALFYVHSLSSFGNKFLNLKVLGVKNMVGSAGKKIADYNQKNNFIVTKESIDLFTGDAYDYTMELNGSSGYAANTIWNSLGIGPR